MILSIILTAVFLGFIGGITPGPILLVALSEILQSPEKGLTKGRMYIFVSALTEFCIGLFLVVTSSWLKIPSIFFHVFAVFGVVLLIYIAIQLYKIKGTDYTKEQKQIDIKHIVMLMIFNGPLWIFWVSVCLPTAFSLGDVLKYGEYLFIIIFQISMIVAMFVIFYGFNSLRKFLTNEKVIKKVFTVLSVLVFFIALKVLFSEIKFFLL